MNPSGKADLWCSVDPMLQILAAKWAIPILQLLLNNPKRPAELAKSLKGINPKILTERLRDLEKWSLITRREYKEIPPRVEYAITARGHELLHAAASVRDLAQRWSGIGDIAELEHNKECIHCAGLESFDSTSTKALPSADILPSRSSESKARVYFVGTGPGAKDLITIRGANILKNADTVLYGASQVPEAVFDHCPADVELINIDSFALEEQLEQYIYAKEKALNVVRLCPGDPTIFGFITEHIDVLNNLGIDYEIIPGVSRITSSASSLGCSLSQNGIAESIILTYVGSRSANVSNKPPRSQDLKKLESLAVHQTTMCIFLSGTHFPETIQSLLKCYAPTTPVALVGHAGQADERKHISTLGGLLSEVDIKDWQIVTIMLVGDILKSNNLQTTNPDVIIDLMADSVLSTAS